MSSSLPEELALHVLKLHGSVLHDFIICTLGMASGKVIGTAILYTGTSE